MSRRAQRVAWWVGAAVLAGAVTIGVVVLWRGFPWLMAAFSGLAVGILVFVTLQTSYRLARIFGRRTDD